MPVAGAVSNVAGEASSSVSVLAYDGMSAFETGIVTEVFGLSWPDIDMPAYTLTICTEGSEPVRMVGGATLQSPHGLDALIEADTVIIPSVKPLPPDPSPDLISALRQAHRRRSRIVSICSGAFALAAAGLLDHRRATTHWSYADDLRRLYPLVEVDPRPLYVDGGDVLTSAGCAAGLDLCLHLVRKDHGPAIANAIARRLVVAPHRPGGQAQYIEQPVPADLDDDRVSASMAWALHHLHTRITLPDLARRATMSERSYLRHFARCTGTTPIRWLIAQRVQSSLSLLETTDAAVEEIAAAVGFETAVTFRHHFGRAMRTSPGAYRRTFRAADAAITPPHRTAAD
ncbi:helix-turn-helix domain-containing protein [Actinopolymorpha sp. B17G11]|uniref:helix-turn-helix domain-containing protein n=1 Tax=Actinopolymorpha sp. B17G11 TaxID=3160861 RepID=UPI0032E3C70F